MLVERKEYQSFALPICVGLDLDMFAELFSCPKAPAPQPHNVPSFLTCPNVLCDAVIKLFSESFLMNVGTL